MKCRRWQVEISAWLDHQLSSREAESLQAHLAECPDCRSFYQDQLEAYSLLEQATKLRLQPGPQIWAGVRARIVESASGSEHSWWPRHWDVLRIPRMAYGVLTLMILVAGMFWMLRWQPDSLELRQLAELEAFSLEVAGNPFILEARFERENPFLPVAFGEDGNPFSQNRGGK
jgi:predicted anti-sigma-YlaC factor YlaD